MSKVLKVIGWVLVLYGIVGGCGTMARGNYDGETFLIYLAIIAISLVLAWLCFNKAKKIEYKKTAALTSDPNLKNNTQQTSTDVSTNEREVKYLNGIETSKDSDAADAISEAHTKKRKTGMRTAIIVAIIIVVVSAVLNQIRKANHGEIRSQIEQFNNMCPMPIAGGAGEIESAEVDGDFLVFHFKYAPKFFDRTSFEEEPDAARDLLLASFLARGTSGETLLSQITGDGLGVRIDIDDSNGGNFISKMSPDYIKNKLAEIDSDPSAALHDALELKLRSESKHLPIRIADGMTITECKLDKNDMLALIVTDENLYSIDDFRSQINAIRSEMVKTIGSGTDVGTRAMVNICQEVHCGLVFRLIGSQTGDTVDIRLPYEDIAASSQTFIGMPNVP